ncbi:hypothetical protein K435DRAFT_880179 [Dendrothele bispora CBS 962.96]|uniref:Uncharacterized protein n=1 Tax=Dendrothele bispora (strain CBS 962.96) TaxID=1314807 RepID=A0A4S8KJV3_DENBC|nr:hypothetical protein K435DRAFT_880179 [Dendrothele bispora CBS 962.96]
MRERCIPQPAIGVLIGFFPALPPVRAIWSLTVEVFVSIFTVPPSPFGSVSNASDVRQHGYTDAASLSMSAAMLSTLGLRVSGLFSSVDLSTRP